MENYKKGDKQESSSHVDGKNHKEGVMMYRIRLGFAAYARMNTATDQARRMMYIVVKNVSSPN